MQHRHTGPALPLFLKVIFATITAWFSSVTRPVTGSTSSGPFNIAVVRVRRLRSCLVGTAWVGSIREHGMVHTVLRSDTLHTNEKLLILLLQQQSGHTSFLLPVARPHMPCSESRGLGMSSHPISGLHHHAITLTARTPNALLPHFCLIVYGPGRMPEHAKLPHAQCC
jgi:hypothetical protein